MQCWQRQLLNVVVVPFQDKSLPIYTYFPFAASACFDPSPVLLGHFTNSSECDVELFPRRKVWNLQHCILKVSAFTTPEIHFEGGHMKGPYSSIIYDVANAMNFRSKFINTNGSVGAGLASTLQRTGLQGDVFTGRAHLGIALLQPVDFQYLDYDSLAWTVCITWFAPSKLRKKSMWWLVIGEFALSVWGLLILDTIFMIAADTAIQRFSRQPQKYQYVYRYLYSWAALLQSSAGTLHLSSVSSRIVWISWLVSCLVISTGYLSALKSFRAAPIFENSVKTLQDLADAGFEAWYPQPFGRMIRELSINNVTMSKLLSHSVSYSADKSETMQAMLRSKQMTLLGMEIESRALARKNNVELYPLPNTCMLTTSMHFFVMTKHSVFTEAVSTVMGRLTQAGIIQWRLGEYQTVSVSRNLTANYIQPKPINRANVYPCLLLLAGGLSVSALVFLSELLLSQIWRISSWDGVDLVSRKGIVQ